MTTRKINTSKNPKRYLSVGSNRSSTAATITKPRSVETFRSNNRMVNSLINSGGFGFKYYINEEKKNVPEVKEKLNEEIDRLLHFYMGKLNEKDVSYDNSEDDSMDNFQTVENVININVNEDKVSPNENIKKEDIAIEKDRSDIKTNESIKKDVSSVVDDKNEISKDDENIINEIPNIVVDDIEEELEKVNTEKNEIQIGDILNEIKKTDKSNQELNESSDDYDEIRLNKTSIEVLRQDIDYFDIEYMCRCLGLAMMKHLENGKDHQHILDIINNQEKFSFFNSIYNTNFGFLSSFFNFDTETEKISNLDRIDLFDKKQEQMISFVSKIKSDSSEPTLKPVKNFFDTDVNLINNYFKQSKQNKYNNVNQNTKQILIQDLNAIHEVDSIEYTNINALKTVKQDKTEYIDLLKQSVQLFNEDDNKNIKIEDTPLHNKFSSYNINDPEEEIETDKIIEEKEEKDDVFESGIMESNYIIDINSAEKLKSYLLKTVELYDDDYDYRTQSVTHKRYIPQTDPHAIYEFCANVMILTKMEKEVIIITMIYIERFIFNTGLLINPRNWKRLLFTSMIIASKIWDDDSFENNHFSQVFTHLSVGEINMMERTFLELINYKVYVKCSEYFKYFFIIKSIALKYNFDGINMVPVSVERMMRIQEHAYMVQKRFRKKYSYNNSAEF